MDPMWLLVLPIPIMLVICIVATTKILKKKKSEYEEYLHQNQLLQEQLRRYEMVTLGMPESEMLSIMGEGYNTSLLKNGRKKFEWRINGKSRPSYGEREYSGVQKVTIYTVDGLV